MSEALCAQHAESLQRLCGVTERMDQKLDRIIERIDGLEKTQISQQEQIEQLKKSVLIAGWTRKGVAMFASSGAMIGILAFFSGAAKAAILWAGNKL